MSHTPQKPSIPVLDEKQIQWQINTGSDKIHAKRIPGWFRRLKWGASSLWLIFFLGPYLRWDDRQAVLFDIPARQFHLFGITVHPQDVWPLTFVLLFLVALLLLATVVAGRAFCGYLCFQTVWTDLFTWIENKLEGSPQKRYELDTQAWNVNKVKIKASKHLLWLIISALTGLSFAAWFTDAYQLWGDYFSLQAHSAAWIVLALFTVGTYIFAGFMREQVCLWLCPYSRIQAVMYDDHTKVPTYDEQRGEPRAKINKSSTRQPGACVDCDQCLAVCPTGIDIREGQQIGCTTCGLCIDACDSVMNKINRPKGLIRYASAEQLESRKALKLWQRPQVLLMATFTLSMLAATAYGLNNMTQTELSVIDSRQPMYVQLSDGRIQNRYQVRIFNKTDKEQHYRIHVSGLEAMSIEGIEEAIQAKPGKMITTNVIIKSEKSALSFAFTPLVFEIKNIASKHKQTTTYTSTFKGPRI